MNDIVHSASSQLFCQYLSVEMVSSITQDPYSIVLSLSLDSFTNLKIGHPLRLTELVCRKGMSPFFGRHRQYGLGSCFLVLLISRKHGGVKDRVLSGLPVVRS